MSYGPSRGIYTGYRTVIIDAVAGMAILKYMSFSIEHVKLVYVRGHKDIFVRARTFRD